MRSLRRRRGVQASVTDLARFSKAVSLAAFRPFSSAADALEQCNAVSEGSPPPHTRSPSKHGASPRAAQCLPVLLCPLA